MPDSFPLLLVRVLTDDPRVPVGEEPAGVGLPEPNVEFVVRRDPVPVRARGEREALPEERWRGTVLRVLSLIHI